MEFDWLNVSFDLAALPPRDIEESFEDPFALKLLPDVETQRAKMARYFSLGKSLTGRGVFCFFWTDGKKYRVIHARVMTPEEEHFYERKKSENI